MSLHDLDAPSEQRRPSWTVALHIAFLAIVGVGMLLLGIAHWKSGWSSLTYFAWGMVISVAGLLLNLLFCAVMAFFQPTSRKLSMWMAAISVVLLLGIALLWRAA